MVFQASPTRSIIFFGVFLLFFHEFPTRLVCSETNNITSFSSPPPPVCYISDDCRTSTNNSRIFGTNQGYDVGGNQSVCWRSDYDDDRILATNDINDPASIVLMNEILVNDTQGSNFGQFVDCANSSTLVVDTDTTSSYIYNISDNGQDKIYLKQNVSFPLSLNIDLCQAPYYSIDKPDNIQAWFRIMICAAWKVGYCEPFLDTGTWSSYYPGGYENISSDEFSYEPNKTVLHVLPTDSYNNIFVSKWVAFNISRVNGSDCQYNKEFNISAKTMDSAAEGFYFSIGHATTLLHHTSNNSSDNNNSKTAMRIDMAKKIGNGLFYLGSYPKPRLISKSLKIYTGIIIGICSCITIGMLCLIVRYRNHEVMIMAQAGSLGWLCSTSLIVIVFSCIILPTNNLFCKFNNLLLIPATIMPSIMVGRLWRVYATLMAASRLGRKRFGNESGNEAQKRLANASHQTEQHLMNLLSFIALSRCAVCKKNGITFRCNADRTNSSTIRTKTTKWDTTRLVLVLALPQIVLQIFNVAAYDGHIQMALSPNGEYASQVCVRESSKSFDLVFYTGIILFVMMHFLAFTVACYSRNIPSAFNDRDQIFNSSIINGICSAIFLLVTVIFDATLRNPSATAGLYITLMVAIAMITNTCVVLPKIRRVLSGEPVVVTKLLRDMNRYGSVARSDGTATNNDQRGSVARPDGTAANTDQRDPPLVRILPNDPIPDAMEKHLHRLKDVISIITNQWYVVSFI